MAKDKGGKGDGTGAAGGKSEADLQAKLEAEVNANLEAEPQVFDDEYKGELDDLKAQAADLGQGPLPTLDDETAADLTTQLEAQKGELDMRRKQEQEALLLRMFGSGAQQSTVAGEAAGLMLYGQEQTHRQLLSDDAARRLGARAEMADRMMNSIAFQAQVAQGQQQVALSAFGIEVQQAESAKDRASSMLDSLYGRRSSEKMAKIGADAQIKSAGISARASMYGADRSLDAAKVHAGATMGAAQLQFKLGMEGIASGDRQFNADLGFRDKTLGFQDQWHGQEMALSEKELQYQDKWNDAQLSQQKTAMYMNFVGGILSDAALKTDVVGIPDAIEKVKGLHGVKWNWLGGKADAGLLAQDVQKVMPEAVTEIEEGFLVVNYPAVFGVLVEAVNELIERSDNGAA